MFAATDDVTDTSQLADDALPDANHNSFANLDAREEHDEDSTLPEEDGIGVDVTAAVDDTTTTPSTAQDAPVTGELSQEEQPSSSDADDDDGDISLVGSPRITDQASTSIAPFSHRRHDSVPPKKYDATAELTASLASTSLRHAIAEEEADMSIPHHDEIAEGDVDLSSFSARRRTGPRDESASIPPFVVIDRSDLNFVDITLDASAGDSPLGRSPSGPPNPLAGSNKTAEQIRSDAISSQDVQSGSDDAAAASTEPVSSSTSNVRLSVNEFNPPRSPQPDEEGGNRSVEGRYRGRRSAPSSRAGSPTGSPRRSPPRRSSETQSQDPADLSAARQNTNENGLSIAPPPILLAADENGNISVVPDSLISPRTVSQDLHDEQAEVSSRAPEEDSSAPASGDNSIALDAADSSRKATSLSEEVRAVEAIEASTTPELSGEHAASPTPPGPDSLSPNPPPGLTDKADQVDPKARRSSSSATSNAVDSRTRMTTLPAKTKNEEMAHRADFERMMIAAKEAERKKREEEEERRRKRQDEQREALGRWEKEILPSWSRARKDPELEQLWWQGVPPSIRGRVWALAIGNPLMLSRSLLEQSEKKAAASGAIEQTIPRRVLDQIETDVEDTLPSLKLFQKTGPLHEDLIRICRAFVLVRIGQLAQLDLAGNANKAASSHQSPLLQQVELRPLSMAGTSAAPPNTDEGVQHSEPEDEYQRRGIDIYQPGLASLAAVLLVNMSINTAFIALLNLIESKTWLRALYSLLPNHLTPSAPTSPVKIRPSSIASSTGASGSAYALPPKDKSIRGFERVLETFLGDQMPKAYANLLGHNVRLYRTVLRDWVSTLWSRWLDLDTVMRIWDVILLDESEGMIYRICLALVQTLESRLYVPDQEELESILRGTNKAALGVWRREKEMKGELEVHVRGARSPRHTRSIPQTPEDLPHPISSTSSIASGTESDTMVPSRSSSLATPEFAPSSDHGPTEVDDIVPRDYIYEQYAIQEHHIFDTLEAQRGWWKQSTLQRLLERELSE